MANGKAMTVGEMASLFLDPATPVRIDAFDGSHFGPADADLKVKIATPNCMYQLLAHPNEIGIVRSYILGDFDVDGIDYATRIRRCASWCRCPNTFAHSLPHQLPAYLPAS